MNPQVLIFLHARNASTSPVPISVSLVTLAHVCAGCSARGWHSRKPSSTQCHPCPSEAKSSSFGSSQRSSSATNFQPLFEGLDPSAVRHHLTPGTSVCRYAGQLQTLAFELLIKPEESNSFRIRIRHTHEFPSNRTSFQKKYRKTNTETGRTKKVYSSFPRTNIISEN